MHLAIDVTLELGAFFVHLSGVREREDLKSSRVREYGAVPIHKTMNPTELAKHLWARSQQKVISVREQNVGTDLFERFNGLALDGGLGAYGHENRRFHGTMQGRKARCAGL